MVVNGDGVYSKHYYAGSQRIVSRLGDHDASIFELPCAGCSKNSNNNFDAAKLQQAQKDDLQNYAKKAKKGKVQFKEYKPIPLEEQEKALAEENDTVDKPTPPIVIKTPPIYYYHPDHLGTSTALTDFNGKAYQFFLNLPFGETMAEQLGQNYYNTPYKFNGKELDDETGFYYYGARYYDPRVSIWLSVDSEFESAPDYSPYNYTMDNPVNLTDPDGNWPWPSWSSIKNRAQNMVKDLAYATAAKAASVACNYINQKTNAIKKSIKSGATKLANALTIEQKDGFPLRTSGESKSGIGDETGFFKEAKGAKYSGSIDVEVFLVGSEAITPEFENKIAEGTQIASELATTPFGEIVNSFTPNSPQTDTPDAPSNGKIPMSIKTYYATGTEDWNESRVQEGKPRDTSVVPSQKPVIDRMSAQNRKRAEQARNSNNRELQKKIDYYKQ